MSALVRLRLTAFTRTGQALAPLLGALLVLGIIYGGGTAEVGEAYGFSATVMFPVIAWQTKILLDVEPDVQRRLAIVALGPRREWLSGLAAAAVAGMVVVLLAVLVPLALGGVKGADSAAGPSFVEGLTAGVWAHLLLIPPALALGALASRAATANQGRRLAVLVGGVVLVIILGLRSSPVPWLVPPAMATGRATMHGLAVVPMIGYTVQALVWTVAALTGYAWLRRTRP